MAFRSRIPSHFPFNLDIVFVPAGRRGLWEANERDAVNVTRVLYNGIEGILNEIPETKRGLACNDDGSMGLGLVVSHAARPQSRDNLNNI
jgi:hypothetical protein